VAGYRILTGRFAVNLPRPVPEIQAVFAARGGVLEEVTTPVLTHFDLWDGNILSGSRAAGPCDRSLRPSIAGQRRASLADPGRWRPGYGWSVVPRCSSPGGRSAPAASCGGGGAGATGSAAVARRATRCRSASVSGSIRYRPRRCEP
jgi:hypothetical protein